MNKVAVRTLTGLTIGLAAAGIVWLDTRLGDGVVPRYVGILLGIICVIELAKMWKDTGTILVGMGALLMANGRFEQVASTSPEALGLDALFVVGVAVFASLLVQGFSRFEASGTWKASYPLWLRALLATWIAFPLLALVPFVGEFGTWGLVALIVLSKIGDIAGYFVGRAIGKRHPFPTISPNKTWAGCTASLVAGTLAGLLVVQVGWLETTFAVGAFLGAGTNLFAQAGDLFESWVKRKSGVKDSSAIMGASGGMLDVVDSLLFTVPFALFVWPLALAS